jgi:hypothetical protein
MKRMRFYLDTSVINFLFVTDAPDFRAVTVDFFENHAERHDLFISDVVLLEMERDPNQEHRSQLFEAVRKYGLEVLPGDSHEAVVELATLYIERGAIPRNKEEDAQHVAYATVYEMDALLSWNFKHLANVNREARIHIVNMEAGYRYPIRLLSPLEAIYEP